MKFAAITSALLLATPVGAHPHIFVDVGFEVSVNAKGQLTHIKVTWAYDALFSLLVTQDLGLDADGDAVLTPQEEAALTGFDMRWVEGYNGDLVATLADVPLDLSRPRAATAVMRAGRIITTHERDVAGKPRMAKNVLSLAPFDASYYTAYDVRMGVAVEGLEGCEIAKDLPDLDTEMQKLQQELATLSADQDAIEMGFPEVGANFATTVRVSCAGR